MKKARLRRTLIRGLEEAVAHERGGGSLRVTRMEVPEPARRWRKERIAEVRKRRFGVSQPVFAAILSVTAATVRAWEQGRKTPSGAASRLLELADLQPDVFQKLAEVQAR